MDALRQCGTPFHGGDRGSNPLGDANIIGMLGNFDPRKLAAYGKYTAKMLPDGSGQSWIVRLLD